MAERRAARRQTRQQFEIQAATTRFESAQQQARASFQAEQQGILQGFQQKMSEYGQQLQTYEQQARQFQESVQAYNQSVERYNTVTAIPGATFYSARVQGRPNTFLLADMGRSQAEWDRFLLNQPAGQALAGLPGVRVDTWADRQQRIGGFDAAQLPDNLMLQQVGTTGGGAPMFQLAQRAGPDPGEFTAQLGSAPQAPSVPSIEGLGEKYTAAIEREREFFEREVGERRAASMRARRRIGARPLLSGE